MKTTKLFSVSLSLMLLGLLVFVSSCKEDFEYSLSPTDLHLSWQKGSSSSFVITFTEGEGEWRVTHTPSFVNVYPQSGTGNETIKVTSINDNTKQPLEDIITIECKGAKVKTQSLNVIQDKLTDCYTEPSNILLMSDGLAYNWEFGHNTKYFYWGIFTQTDYNKMSESEVLRKLVTGKVDDRILPDNNDYACNYNLHAKTQYVVVTVSYAENDVQGDVVVTPLTTKSTNNQPEAAIKDVQYYKDYSNNYYYGWDIKKNTYCSQYYTYAAASPSYFWIYYLLEDGCYPMIAWLVKNEIQKDGEDHTTSMNDVSSSLPFNNGRDQFYAAQVENGTSYFSAFPYSDKYFCVFTWGTGTNGELSGVINAVWFDFTEDTSSVKHGKALKAIAPKHNTDEPKKLIINSKDLKLRRLK